MIKRFIALSGIIAAAFSPVSSFAYVEMGDAFIMGTSLYCTGMAPCFADFNNDCQQFSSGTKYMIYNVNGDGRWTEYTIYSTDDEAINQNNQRSQEQGFNEGSSFTVAPVTVGG